MSATVDPEVVTPVELPVAPPKPKASGRPFLRRVMHVVRRGHLYLGLFLLPWAILYGVTAFLFNHPTAFADNPSTTFGREATAGTPLDGLASPREQAEVVLARLNEMHKPAAPFTLGPGEPRYSREFAFATVKADGQTVSVLVDVKTGGGTVRGTADKPKAEPAKAPFAVGSGPPNGGGRGGRGGGGPPRGDGERPAAKGLLLDGESLPDRVKAAVPVILERTGFPTGEVTVTSVPDLVFPVEADGKAWTATYSHTTGAVSGAPAEAREGPNWRQFLLRLHTAHGYPTETNGRWAWAVVVDVMAGVMVFWGLSGLLMWWQIKATRKLGLVVLVLSAAAAAWLGFAMHAAMTG